MLGILGSGLYSRSELTNIRNKYQYAFVWNLLCCSAAPLLSSGAALSSGSAEQHIAFASPTLIGISGRGCCRQEITLHKWWSVHDGVVPLCRSWTVLKMTLVWSMMRRGINGFGVVARADIRQHHRRRSIADKFDNQAFDNYKQENGGSIFDVSLSVASLITLSVSVSVCHFGSFCARLVICYPQNATSNSLGPYFQRSFSD